MFCTPLFEDLAAGRTYGFGRVLAVQEVLTIQGFHPLTCRLVLHRPQAHDHSFGPRHLEGPAQAEDPFSRFDLTHPRITGGEHRPIHTLQVDAGDLSRRENAIGFVRLRRNASVSASEGQS